MVSRTISIRLSEKEVKTLSYIDKYFPEFDNLSEVFKISLNKYWIPKINEKIRANRWNIYYYYFNPICVTHHTTQSENREPRIIYIIYLGTRRIVKCNMTNNIIIYLTTRELQIVNCKLYYNNSQKTRKKYYFHFSHIIY